MSKKHLLPDENEEFLDRLGLTEIDKKVYIAALDGGLVSAGEIQQFTEITDLGKILESIRDLVDLGLIKKAQGMMPRYYATLPFFRETLSVEREFKFALEAMLHSLAQAKQDTIKTRELIMATRFPKIVDTLLDEYYKGILSPFIDSIDSLKQNIQDELIPFAKEVDTHSTNIKEEINLMLKPVSEYADLLTHQFDLGITNQSGGLTKYLEDRTNQRLGSLKEAHTAVGTNLENLKHELASLTQELRSLHLSLQDEQQQVITSEAGFKQTIASYQGGIEEVNSAKKEVQAELVVAREQIKRLIASNPGDLDQQVDNLFQSLTEKIKKINLSGDQILDSLNQASNHLSSSTSSMSSTVSSLDQITSATSGKLNSYFDDLKSSMTSIFNILNEQDEKSLGQLQDQLEAAISQLQSSILKEGEGIKTRLTEHLQTILKQQDATLDRWQDNMVNQFSKPNKIIDPFLKRWLDDIAPIIDNFKKQTDEALKDILEPIVNLENGVFATLTERIGFVKAMIQSRSNDLQQVLEMAKNFDFTKTSDTWVVVGLPAIYASLTDLLLRTRTRVTIITPYLDLELAEVARTLKNTIRITLVTDIDPDRDARMVAKLEETGRINLRHYPDRDLYACIRDSEELVFGYIRENEETMGIRASTPSIVKLIEDRFNETVIRNSKQI